jgi:hypothetical protein
VRWDALRREAWRDVVSGTSRATLVALLLALVVLGGQIADLLAVQSVTDRATAFRAAGADVLVLSASGRVDGARCELLADQPDVDAAGALRREADRYAAALPASSIPAYAVTPGFTRVVAPDAAAGAGVVVSQDHADVLATSPGDDLTLVGGSTTVAAVYPWPQDGRTSGYGYALLEPTSDRAPYDSCWVRAWPMTTTTEQLLRGVTIAGTPAAGTPATEISQLNSTLGRAFDPSDALVHRVTRWAPLAVLLLTAVIAFGATRLRRLELASARHLGVRRRDQVLVLALESLAWSAPVVLLAAVSAALVVAGGSAENVGTMLALGALSPLAGAVGAGVGAVLAVLSVREGDLLRFVKER